MIERPIVTYLHFGSLGVWGFRQKSIINKKDYFISSH